MGSMVENEDGSFTVHLSDEEFTEMKAALDAAPARDLPKLQRLLDRTPPWDDTGD